MFGSDVIEKALKSMEKATAKATLDGIEKGAKILGDIVAAKMDELHERDRKRDEEYRDRTGRTK